MRPTADRALPAARVNGLLIRELGDEVLVYDLDRHKAHCLNQTAAMIWNQCDGERTASQIATELSDAAGAPVSEDVVWLGLAGLERAHLLTDPAISSSEAKSISRRDLLRRAGIAAAVGLPVVASIIAPRASEAGTCKTTGQACTANSECCSNLCNGAPTGACG